MDDIGLIEKLNNFNLDEKAKMEFKDRLITLRKQKGWSQEVLAEKVDVTRQTISKWESRQTMPEVDNVIRLCKLYNLTMDELLYGEDKNKSEDINKNDIVKQDDDSVHNENDNNVTSGEKSNINTQINKVDGEFDNIESKRIENKFLDKIIKKYLPKIIISVIFLGLAAYLISVIHNFFILKEINDKFKSYKDVNNCYYERKEIVSNDTGTLYAVNTKYWYKDGILKREEKRTENGVTKTNYVYIDTNKNIKYNLFEEDKKGIKRLNIYNHMELEKGILDYLIGINYNSSNFEIFKYSLISKINTNERKYIVERIMENYRKYIYDKESAMIEQSFTIDSDNEETKILHNIQINVVTDEDIYLNLEDYDIQEER